MAGFPTRAGSCHEFGHSRTGVVSCSVCVGWPECLGCFVAYRFGNEIYWEHSDKGFMSTIPLLFSECHQPVPNESSYHEVLSNIAVLRSKLQSQLGGQNTNDIFRCFHCGSIFLRAHPAASHDPLNSFHFDPLDFFEVTLQVAFGTVRTSAKHELAWLGVFELEHTFSPNDPPNKKQ